jgi:hypothetical protein
MTVREHALTLLATLVLKLGGVPGNLSLSTDLDDDTDARDLAQVR